MKLFVGTPAYDGLLHHGYVHALLGKVDALRDRGIDVRWLACRDKVAACRSN